MISARTARIDDNLGRGPMVRIHFPPGKNQHLLPKSVFDRPGSDRWNLASTTFPDAGRWFESGSLRRGVNCEPVQADKSLAVYGVRTSWPRISPGLLASVWRLTYNFPASRSEI